MRLKQITALATSAFLVTAVGGCGSDPEQMQAGNAAGSQTIQKQPLDEKLHNQLPADIQKAGTITAANTGSFPPYTIVSNSGDGLEGAVADLSDALGQTLGIDIKHTTVDGLSGLLTGMQAGRYDLSLGPVGDFKERQAQATFVDYVQEYVVFAVQKGNPEGIDSLESACGARIAVQAGGSAEEVIQTQAAKCKDEGKDPIEVQSYKDQPSSILAVRSNRADAFFSSQAPLTYFVKQSNGQLELSGVGQENGFEDLFQGALVPTDSKLDKVLLEAFDKLVENGTYEQIMAKWGIKKNMIHEPGVNLGQS